MNAALSLNNRHETTPAQQAKRLEAFEIALRDERIYALEEMLTSDREDWEYEQGVLREQLALMANEQKLSHERAAEGLKREQAIRMKIRQLADDKEKLQAEVERLAVQDKEKAEALAGAKEMRTRNHQLATQNVQLDKALDKAIADINSGQELKPEGIFEPTRLGRWELFTSARNGWYQVLDVENEVSQTVRVEGGELITPKIRPVPKAIAAEVLAFHQEFFGGAA